MGNEHVLEAIDKMMHAEEERRTRIGPAQHSKDHDSTSRMIYQLMQNALGRGFGEKLTKRFAQYWFAQDIDLRVNKLREEGPPSRQSAAQKSQRLSEESGQALNRALNDYLDVVRPHLTKAEKDKERDHLRQWRIEGRIYVQLVNTFDNSSILLLLPLKNSSLFGGNGNSRRSVYRSDTLHTIVSNNRSRVQNIRDFEREPFLHALCILRPDIKSQLFPRVEQARLLIEKRIAFEVGLQSTSHSFHRGASPAEESRD